MGYAIAFVVVLVILLSAVTIGARGLRRYDAPRIEPKTSSFAEFMDSMFRKPAVAKPPIPNGALVKFVTSTGRKMSAIVVDHSRRGYDLRLAGHPAAAAFRRRNVTT